MAGLATRGAEVGDIRICGEHQLYVLDLNFLSFTFSLVNK